MSSFTFFPLRCYIPPPAARNAAADIPPRLQALCLPRVLAPTRTNRRQDGERTRRPSSRTKPPWRLHRAPASLGTLTGSAASPSTTARRVRSLCRSCGRGTQHMRGKRSCYNGVVHVCRVEAGCTLVVHFLVARVCIAPERWKTLGLSSHFACTVGPHRMKSRTSRNFTETTGT